MTRLVPAAVSFAVVLVAYWAYALVAVPLIEPEIEGGRLARPSPLPGDGADLADKRLQRFRNLFPADSWIHKAPKILESDRVVLLTQDYRNLGDGRIEIRPCTMIFIPAEADNDADKLRESVILEAPDGAILEFDRPLELSKAKIGRLIGGKLKGRITIRSKGKQPGPNDDLLIVTRDVQLSEQHVWTTHPVDFRLGPNYGRGEQMRIKLLASGEEGSAGGSGFEFAGVESFEVRRVKRLHLELSDRKVPLQTAVAQQKTTPADADKRLPLETNMPPGTGMPLGAGMPLGTGMPVEITCRGPFLFDVVGKVATFRDQVDVLRINPHGPGDQLSCELLSVFFTDRDAPSNKPSSRPLRDSKTGKKRQSLDLKPLRLEARGNPVVVTAPSRKAQARGQRFEYNLQTG